MGADRLRGVQVARVGRTRILVHPLWLAGTPLLTALFALGRLTDPATAEMWAVQPAAWAVCILLHEAGHALVGCALGVPVRAVALLPVGGATRFARAPRPGREELCTAAAGPAASLMLMGLAWVAGARLPDAAGGAMWALACFNAGVFAANTLPALPLDGGRVVRALVWLRRRDLDGATAAVGRVGVASGYGLGVLAGASLILLPGGPVVTAALAVVLLCTGRRLVRQGGARGSRAVAEP
jgi:Zn-dependent protease